MTEVLIQVDGMTCDHCNRAIEQAVGAMPGAERVSADYATGRVVASFSLDPDPAAIRGAVEEEGYGVVSVSVNTP